MGMRIYQLPPAIANQIAAGEVIERPASVVKELLENSFDAGATTIAIEIGYGGLNQIKISDDGLGIMAEDLPLAISAHATSKIKTLNDLYAIDSMGFRGEALASIASVAKLTISSKPALQDHAMKLQCKGDAFTLSPCARTVGTSIDVSDLFFNAPVRKRFLKSEKLEFQAIETLVKRFALSAPQIALTLTHNNKLVLSLPSATNDQALSVRMAKLLGQSFVKDAIFLDVERGGMRLHGWISGPTCQRSQNDRQWIYINQRMVKDKLIHHALKQSYDGLLYPGRFPSCLLYLTIDKSEVDVNVHPTKHEVRFQQPRLVHDFFTSQLQEALRAINASADATDYQPTSTPSQLSIAEPYSHIVSLPQINYQLDHEPLNVTPVPFVGSFKVARPPLRPPQKEPIPVFERPWVVLNNRYAIVFIKQQPFMVDVVALHQHETACQLLECALPFDTRPLLVPVRYALPSTLKNLFNALKLGLVPLGVQIDLEDNDTILVRSIPVQIPYLDLGSYFDAIAQQPDFNADTLMTLLSQSQVIDPRLLSTEERLGLNLRLSSLLHQEVILPPVFKAFSVADCRVFLDV